MTQRYRSVGTAAHDGGCIVASSPHLKVYTPSGSYVAACKFPQDAGLLAAKYGNGATIRHGHRNVVWREGHEEPGRHDDVTLATLIQRRVLGRDWQ